MTSPRISRLITYVRVNIITENSESFKPKSALQWAEQAFFQANLEPVKTIAKMELLSGFLQAKSKLTKAIA